MWLLAHVAPTDAVCGASVGTDVFDEHGNVVLHIDGNGHETSFTYDVSGRLVSRTSADAAKLPKIYFVNWFRKGDDGRFMWPGFGDNSRVLKWICQRIEGQVKANETAIGNIPFAEDIDLANNDENAKFHVVKADLDEILKVDVEGWKKEIATVGASYDEYDAKPSKDSKVASKTARRVPKALRQVLADVTAALNK